MTVNHKGELTKMNTAPNRMFDGGTILREYVFVDESTLILYHTGNTFTVAESTPLNDWMINPTTFTSYVAALERFDIVKQVMERQIPCCTFLE